MRPMYRRATWLAALSVLTLGLSGCGALGGMQSMPDAEVGACMNAADLEGQISGSEGGEVTELPTVECSEPHDAEVIAAIEMPDGDYPGESAVDEATNDGCRKAFEDYVGAPYEDVEELDMYSIFPTEQTWGIGDREILCIAYTLDGTKSTGSFKNSEG